MLGQWVNGWFGASPDLASANIVERPPVKAKTFVHKKNNRKEKRGRDWERRDRDWERRDRDWERRDRDSERRNRRGRDSGRDKRAR